MNKNLVFVSVIAVTSVLVTQISAEDHPSSSTAKDEEPKQQAAESSRAFLEELVNANDKDNNDALSKEEAVDFTYELMLLNTKANAPPDVDIPTASDYAAQSIKRQIRQMLDDEWERMDTDENGELPKDDFVESIIGEHSKDKVESIESDDTIQSTEQPGESSDQEEPEKTSEQ